MSEGQTSRWDRGHIVRGADCIHEWLLPWLPSKYLNFIWIISAFRYIFQNYIRHCETQMLQNSNCNKIPLDSSVCYHFGQVTGTAIMHKDTLAQWPCYNWKKTEKIHKLNVCFAKFKLMLGFYGNKHSGYVVNPMAPEHQLPIPTSMSYHLEVITCLFIQKLTKDRSASIFAAT